MKSLLVALATLAVAATLGLSPDLSEAKRLGGGKAAGMQRQMPAKPAEPPSANPAPTAPTQAAAPMAGAAPAAAAAAGKRSWLAPVAGIAAGLGLAALASHLGFGEGFANLMTVLLLVVVGVAVVRWLMRRRSDPAAQGRSGLALAGAGAPLGRAAQEPTMAAPMARSASPQASAAAAASGAGSAPAGFDAAGFERVAKMIFIRLQAANDAADLEDLRRFTTPELFAALRLDLQERGGVAQQTDVVDLACELVDTAQEDGRLVASVRFRGLIRELADAGAEPFDETWHLVRPLDGSREWAIAGITPHHALA